MSLFTYIKNILSQNENFAKNGEVFKNKVVEAALKLDPALLKILLNDEKSKFAFFQEVDGFLVFDKIKFQKFISNKEFLPDSFTAFKNKIGLTANGEYLTEAKEVVLDFPYKDCVLEGGQTKEDQKRSESFWNTTLAPDEIDRLFDPKVLTNWKKFDKDGEHIVTNISLEDNLIIKGNNLIALHSLNKVYKGKIKLIYIDPPYNTGEDSFRYNDSFNHSTWLTFMKNRLEIAKELLHKDGVIFIQIDNKEEAYLKVLCDGIFGSDNYRNTIITKKGMKSLQKQFKTIKRLNAGFDSILVYTKKAETQLPVLFKNLEEDTSSGWNNHWRGTDRPTMRYEIFGIIPESGQWRWEKKRTLKAMSNYEILVEYIQSRTTESLTNDIVDKYYEEYFYEQGFLENSDFELVRLSKNNKPEHYIPPQSKILLSENWMDISVAGRVTEFEHEKNEELLKRIIEWVTEEGDIVLDFFLGSGTTAVVSHKLNRKYIGVEQMDYGKLDSIFRLQSILSGSKKGIKFKGGGSFITTKLKIDNTILSILEKSVEQNYKTKELVAFLNSNVTKYNISISDIDFPSSYDILTNDEKLLVLYNLIDVNSFYVPYTEMLDETHEISSADIKLNTNFYSL